MLNRDFRDRFHIPLSFFNRDFRDRLAPNRDFRDRFHIPLSFFNRDFREECSELLWLGVGMEYTRQFQC
jgi:hypothetical protein